MNEMTIFITLYAAMHLVEDFIKKLFDWLECWDKEKTRKRNNHVSQKEVLNFYWSLLADELHCLGYDKSAYSTKYETTSFINPDHTIRIGINGAVYGCYSDEEFETITHIVQIAKDATALWQKSVPIQDDSIEGYRILSQIGDTVFAARFIDVTGRKVSYSLWQFDDNTYKNKKDIGVDFIQAKEIFALHLLLNNLSLLPSDEVAKQKMDIYKWLLDESTSN